jgi:tellurite resistance protein
MATRDERVAEAKELEHARKWENAMALWRDLGRENSDTVLLITAAVAAWEGGLTEQAEALFREVCPWK